MNKTLKRVLKNKTMTQEELGELLKFVNLPENHDHYYLNSDVKEDRIGKYRILVLNPLDRDTLTNVKIYELKDDKDITAYRLRYYDILRDEVGNTKKSMQLFVLQKNLEYVYSKELKINEKTGEFKELTDLLNKVKKARSYYTLKVFLNDNASTKQQKSAKKIKKRDHPQ